MTDTKSILAAAGITKALVIDDGFDSDPSPADVSDSRLWAQFFDDINEETERRIISLYPAYESARPEDLMESEDFINFLWRTGDLREGYASQLFSEFVRLKTDDKRYLDSLIGILSSFGLNVLTAGKVGPIDNLDAKLIIADLFLGAAQDKGAIEASIERIKSIYDARRSEPPLIILMSRSSRLEEKRAVFRDEVGIYESTFRIIRKTELVTAGRLARLLSTLASHYSEALKLARFIYAWDEGLNAARKRTLNAIRLLDLPDIAQIQQLLLSAEGSPPGSYLVDVFDRVLLHEVEQEGAIINAALALDELTTKNYPPPYVSGSPNLQSLVHKTLFQNKERLKLPGSGCVVAFGDLLLRKPLVMSEEQGPKMPPTRLGKISRGEILLVISPACDLQRTVESEILLIKGELERVTYADWNSSDHAALRTPIIELSELPAYGIK